MQNQSILEAGASAAILTVLIGAVVFIKNTVLPWFSCLFSGRAKKQSAIVSTIMRAVTEINEKLPGDAQVKLSELTMKSMLNVLRMIPPGELWRFPLAAALIANRASAIVHGALSNKMPFKDIGDIAKSVFILDMSTLLKNSEVNKELADLVAEFIFIAPNSQTVKAQSLWPAIYCASGRSNEAAEIMDAESKLLSDVDLTPNKMMDYLNDLYALGNNAVLVHYVAVATASTLRI